MSHTNKCNYCKSKFCFKFKYRIWSQVAKTLYDKAVKQFEPIETITFMWENKSWTMVDACGDGKPEERSGYLCIDLVAPLTEAQAKKAGNKSDVMVSYGYTWPKELFPPDRDMKLLKAISKVDSERDIDIDIMDLSGDGKHHHCGIKSIIGCKHIKIILEETWSHKR